MDSFLPSRVSNQLATPARRDLARIERSTSRDVALVQARAHVMAEKGRADARAIENVAIDAMQAGASVARHATALAHACPVAEGMLRHIMEESGMALGRIVSDTGRDLR